MTQPAHVLWTGGWDSTFRVLQLLLVEKRSVQPIYVIDGGRSSTLHEIRAMARIRDSVRSRLDSAELLPTEVLIRTDYPIPDDLQQLYDKMSSRFRIGSQFLWLAAIARARAWQDVELSIENQSKRSELDQHVFDRLDDSKIVLSDGHGAELFTPWSLPLIGTRKNEMAETARRHGFYDLLLMRWFCFEPVGDSPCGDCRPCQVAQVEGATEGMEFPSLARRRFRRLVRRVRRLSHVREPRSGGWEASAGHARGLA